MKKFTLLEIIIAVGLFAMLASVCTALMLSASRSLESQKAASGRLEEKIYLDKFLRKYIGNMIPFTWRGNQNRPRPIFNGELASVSFASCLKGSLENGKLSFIEVSLEDHKLTFQRSYRPGGELSEHVLTRGVESIRLRYASVVRGHQSSKHIVWQDRWESNRLDIPLAVRVTVHWIDGNKEDFLWRTAGNSYNERLGNWRNGERVQL